LRYRSPGRAEVGVSDSQNDRVNLAEKLQQFTECWSPRIVGELNGQHVKLAKLEGEFVWHHHEREDELFLVLQGHLSIHLRDRIVELDEGEFFIVPRGVEHKPVTDVETHVLLLEPTSTLNTGNVRNDRTVDAPRRL
ncbi:MAG: cupin domain-containing protein, partial [Planctomycetaceae bacterium]